MPPVLRDQAGATVGSGQSRTCTATFNKQTLPGSLLVCTAVSSGGDAALIGPSGFSLIRERVFGSLKLAMWYYEGAPTASTVSVTTTVDRSLQIRIMEYTGAAMAGALDKVAVATGQTQVANAGQALTPSQSDSIVVSCVANQYASTLQSGVSGLLTALLGQGQITPQSGWGWFGLASDTDDARTRLTMHQAITNAIQAFTFEVVLSAIRPWIAILCSFKGASSGPVRPTAEGDPVLSDAGGEANVVVFGKLATVAPGETGSDPVLATFDGDATIGPFTHQYRLGGWTGLLIGEGTDYRVESVEGLGGWEMRVSDDDLPRGDGGIRGVDLQSARQVVFKLNTDGDPEEVEDRLDFLYRALVPQRDSDWELIWREPGADLRTLRCRPVNLIRSTDWKQILMAEQAFALRAVDPRHYSAVVMNPTVPNTPAAAAIPLIVSVLNQGNGFAYPVIRITPTSVPLSRVELTNVTYDLSMVIEAVMPVGSTLVGDMDARATGAPRSVITIDGQSKYGAWQQPRRDFRLAPGANDLSLVTVPAGAPVACTLQYSHTWSG